MSERETFIAADWPAPVGIIAGTTLRSGGVSSEPFATLNLGALVGDDNDSVSENRQRFLATCGPLSNPLWLRQVHGTAVALEPEYGTIPEADASYSGSAGATCVVLTADCLPVLLTTTEGSEIGAAHAGWRGLLAGVLEATVNAFNTPPEHLLAWLGPAISQAAFEVGSEVRSAYLDDDPATGHFFAPNSRGRWQADLYGLARHRLGRIGVTRVTGGDYCTYNEPQRFFSYRRDGQGGRMASFIYRRT
jgi:YfiH family protein